MYFVVFRNRKRAGLDEVAYARAAARMEELARQQPGFLDFKSFTASDGEVLALSEWESEAAARAWGQEAEHTVVQARGRAEWYEEYAIVTGEAARVHRFSRQ